MIYTDFYCLNASNKQIDQDVLNKFLSPVQGKIAKSIAYWGIFGDDSLAKKYHIPTIKAPIKNPQSESCKTANKMFTEYQIEKLDNMKVIK